MDKELAHLIKKEVDKLHPETVEHYRYLHRRPELSFHEKNTSEYVVSVLKNMGVGFRDKIGGFGVLAWIKGRNPEGKTIALRADMDALPITEANDVEYKSENDGVMHACGHDSHTASLLSVVKIINGMKDRLDGTVLFVFQPGEEKHPGGARLMLEDGVFDELKPDVMVGQHVYVDYPVGTVGFQDGVIMASADEVHLKIKGKGGHGALPHLLNDTVLAASQVVVAMQQVVSRRSNPFKPMVLSFGKFIADGATNVIPDEVVLAGTLRCMDEDERMKAKNIIVEIAKNTALAYGCECEIDVYDGYPCTYNDEGVTALMKQFAIEFLGDEKVAGLPKRMTSEDFGFFSQVYPSTFYRFGVVGAQNCTGLHTSTFLIDEDSLKTSVGTMVYLALKYCS
ncbi:amidohydrolase [Dysgonomonas sp. 216]|uniref:M20 metallopeptidase family protein n=1 Tax=Dysgonomonas sp. 216 TaxID=2302934 RepID=UPI0013D2B343|nr:M20 family metallopeptidase [Dysgonomonas sp. 216]NDW17453.1 amidohydrolase [Dysgonomonas sp. 216]